MDGFANGNVVTVHLQHPIVLFDSDRFFAAGRDFIHFGSQQQEYRLSALTRLVSLGFGRFWQA